VLAVAPFTNESGVPIPVNEIWKVGDGLITAINQTQGWDAVPLNRTIQTMRQMGIDTVPDLKTASALARAMDVDAIVLGTITQWDPYDPPRFGANVILVASDEAALREFDPRGLQGATKEQMPKSISGNLHSLRWSVSTTPLSTERMRISKRTLREDMTSQVASSLRNGTTSWCTAGISNTRPGDWLKVLLTKKQPDQREDKKKVQRKNDLRSPLNR
jgi:hypothetical protein